MKKLILLIVIMVAGNNFAFSQENSKKETIVVIHTKYGDITAKLYNDTPQHRDNFIKLVNEGWYEDSPFHRIIKNFMIQGGGNSDGRQDPGHRIPAEFTPNHYHKKGALSAARQGDQVNPEKESSGCQFYIVQGKKVPESQLASFSKRNGIKYTDEQKNVYKTLGGTPHLDGDYTVFGEVIMGLDVVDKIAAVKTNKMKGDSPVEKLTMTIEIVE
ncbi:MAG: peptidylprolyl isomerase [Bacteroidales bacterium]|nr:peptidylprolyl isomerase [Bacteroidales bacterium]